MEAYLARHRTWGPAAALLVGLAVTGLLVGYLLLLAGRTARVEQLVAERTRALGESEQKLRAILDHTFQFMGLVTPEGILTDANKTALAFSGSLGSQRARQAVLGNAVVDPLSGIAGEASASGEKSGPRGIRPHGSDASGGKWRPVIGSISLSSPSRTRRARWSS